MKNLVKTSFILLALVSMLFTSCKKEYEIPPIHSVPFGDTLTIDEILAMPAKTTFDTASVCGIITADEVSGNLYKTIFIQDRATGKAIELRLNSASAARIGDSVRVCLDPSLMYNPYHNLPQITDKNGNGFNPDGHLLIYPYNRPIEPKTVTIAEIKSGAYIAALVKLDSVEFVEKNVPFCEVGETTNRHLIDATSPDSDENFVVRTSNYANFAYDYMPISKGSLVGIASIYNSTYQITLRSKTEMIFSEWGTPAAPAGGVQAMPYIQSFESFGTYTTFSVEGAQVWEIYKNSMAKMTGYDNGANYANVDWLISSPVAVTGVNQAKVAVNYVAQYQNSDPKDITLQVSMDYEYGKDPTTATWKQMDATYPNTSSWSDFQTVETSLNEFIGQNITVAIKFTSTTSQSRTIEIKSITVQEGEAGGGGGGGGGALTGDGTRENPYTANDVIALNILTSDGNKYWVKDVIVGAVVSSGSSNVFEFSGTAASNTNIIISSNAGTTSQSESVPVQLPAGAVRNGVNIQENPGNYKQEVLLYGTLEYYFGKTIPGVKNVTYAEINGNSFGTDPGAAPQGIFSETFANGQGNFVIENVLMPSELTYVWTHSSQYSCMKASAHTGGAGGPDYATESWLVSPSINLAGVNSATLSFEQAVNYASPTGALSVMISTDYTNAVTSANWTELNLSAWPSGNDWDFVTSTADLTQFAGQTVRIAFKYTSTDSAAATWEVKSFVVE